MAAIYKNFNYMNNSLQEMGLICVDFESESDILVLFLPLM